MSRITELKEKLADAVNSYNQKAQQLQQLQEELLMARGSIQTLQDFITAEEGREDD